MAQVIIIGGSAGSFKVVVSILNAFPADYPAPVFLCLHRLKYMRSGFAEALSLHSKIHVKEPFDKESIMPGIAYLAPANYHMFIENHEQITLSTEAPFNHARPAIDFSLLTAARAYRHLLTGILLSGANQDGALGMQKIKELGGTCIIQDPSDCEVGTMPESALKLSQPDYILSAEQIVNFIQKLS